MGSLPNPPLQTPCWAAGGLKITNCDLQFVAHCSFCGGNTFWREMALFGAKKHENVKNAKSQIYIITDSLTIVQAKKDEKG